MAVPKKALVVGGTSGIGRGIAEFLAGKGCSVTIAGRNEVMGQQVRVYECIFLCAYLCV